MQQQVKKYFNITIQVIWTLLASILLSIVLWLLMLSGLWFTNQIQIPFTVTISQKFAVLPKNDDQLLQWFQTIVKDKKVVEYGATQANGDTLIIKYSILNTRNNIELHPPLENFGYNQPTTKKDVHLDYRKDRTAILNLIVMHLVALDFSLLFFALRKRRKSKLALPKLIGKIKLKMISSAIAYFFLFMLVKIIHGTIVVLLFGQHGIASQEILRSIVETPLITKIIFFLFASFIAPVVEEIFFRGYIFATIEKKTGKFWPAAIISSLLFAIVHQDLVAGPLFFMLGLILAKLYHKHQSLLPSIIVHITNNTIATVLIFLLKP